MVEVKVVLDVGDGSVVLVDEVVVEVVVVSVVLVVVELVEVLVEVLGVVVGAPVVVVVVHWLKSSRQPAVQVTTPSKGCEQRAPPALPSHSSPACRM